MSALTLAGNRPRVLIVDDYVDTLELWSQYLRAEGYDVVQATDGPMAVSTAGACVPDVIVLDLDLPGFSGFEAARLLRTNPATAGIPLIAATGMTRADLLERTRASGFSSLLLKPCPPRALADEIERALATPR